MERHPVPQNLMDVEFKLFGALTIRQFGYLAAGCLIGVMVYFSGLPVILRLIFIVISVGTGLFMSLVKINGQPSTVWLQNFLLSMLVPQERLWRKTALVPEVLREDPTLKLRSDKDVMHLLSGTNKLSRLPVNPLEGLEKEENPIDREEKKELDKIEEHFDFLFESLPQIQESNAGVTKPGTFKRKDELMQTLESPIVAKPTNIAQAVSQSNTGKSVVYSTDSFATVVKPMTTQVNRPLTINKFQKQKGLEINSNLDNNVNYIKGIVLDKNKNPINGSKVRILNLNNQLVKEIVSDASGMFATTSPLPMGDYYIDTTCKGFDFGRYLLNAQGQKQYLIRIVSK